MVSGRHILDLDKQDLESIIAAKNFIEKNYHQHIPIPNLAKSVWLSETKLKQGFLLLFQMSIYEYLVQVRMEKARSLLEGTRKPIKQIAGEIGYKSAKGFIAAFKRTCKMTPAKYRQLT